MAFFDALTATGVKRARASTKPAITNRNSKDNWAPSRLLNFFALLQITTPYVTSTQEHL